MITLVDLQFMIATILGVIIGVVVRDLVNRDKLWFMEK